MSALRSATQLRKIFRFPIHHHPRDVRFHRSTGNLRQRSSDRLECNRVRTLFWSRLDYLQQLLALRDGIVIRVDDFDFHAEPDRGLFGCG